MVTSVIVTELELQKQEYEPTVADKIQRVIYLLEQGERLINDRLYDGSNFCVLGLFADESGLGDWDHSFNYVISKESHNGTILPNDVMKYYNFRDERVSFNLSKLPSDLQNKINCLNYDWNFNLMSSNVNIALFGVNDLGMACEYPYVNQLLADIIRSDAIYKNIKRSSTNCDHANRN